MNSKKSVYFVDKTKVKTVSELAEMCGVDASVIRRRMRCRVMTYNDARRLVIEWMRQGKCGVANASLQFEKMGAQWRRDRLKAAEDGVLYLYEPPRFGAVRSGRL